MSEAKSGEVEVLGGTSVCGRCRAPRPVRQTACPNRCQVERLEVDPPTAAPPRPTVDEHLLAVAWATARRSTCLRAPDGVGAVLAREGRVLSTGYAGSVRGDPHCVDVGCMLDARGKCVRTVHAELNALLQAAAHGVSVDGATAYCTMSPCWDCFKALKSAGVARVVFDVTYTDTLLQERHATAWNVGWERRGTAVFVPGRGLVG